MSVFRKRRFGCTQVICSRAFLPFIDVIVDGPYVEELRDVKLHWKGSKNQRVIDVHQTLESGKIVLWA